MDRVFFPQLRSISLLSLAAAACQVNMASSWLLHHFTKEVCQRPFQNPSSFTGTYLWGSVHSSQQLFKPLDEIGAILLLLLATLIFPALAVHPSCFVPRLFFGTILLWFCWATPVKPFTPQHPIKKLASEEAAAAESTATMEHLTVVNKVPFK